MDIVSLIIVGVVLSFVFRRLKEISKRLDQLESRLSARPDDASAPVLAGPTRVADTIPQFTPIEAVEPSPITPPVIESPINVAAATASSATGPLIAPIPRPAPPPSGPDAAERIRSAFFGFIREQVGSQEWEAILGGNLLNKLGVLVLLIGVTLFLGFSLTRLGPAGKIAVGLAVSLAMLAGGIFAEHRARYVVFGRGLIGGGWAGIYTTAFAAYGLPTARVIESPAVATILLLAVAAAMIAHSIRYRSEAVTGLAYFVGFVTLAISPMSSFALFASIPLVASLLYLANLFRWERIAIAGIVVTYASYAYATRDTVGSSAEFATGQAALAIYWLIYEGFDLAALYREGRRRGPGQLLAALNASGFVGVSILQWLAHRPDDLFVVLAYSAAAFLLSAIARWRIVQLAALADSSLYDRTAAGSYEFSISISSALAVAAICQRYSGYSINIALLLEAQFLFLIGVQAGQSYLQILGALVFAIPAGKLAYDMFDDSTMIVFRGLRFSVTTPIAIVTAAAGYFDRAIAMRARTPRRWRILAWTASIIVGAVIGNEAATAHVGLAWLALGGLLFEAGWLADDFDFRLQSYVASTFGLISIATVNLDLVPVSDSHRWFTLALGALMAYGASLQLMFFSRSTVADRERTYARDGASIGATALLMIMLWHLLPPMLVVVAWIALAVILVEAGFVLIPSALRFEGYAVAALTLMRVFGINLDSWAQTLFISDRLASVIPVIVAFYYLAWRVNAGAQLSARKSIDLGVAGAFLYGAALLAMSLIWYEVAAPYVVDEWAAFGLILLILGRRFSIRQLRLQSYIVALIVFERCWRVNFDVPGVLAHGISIRAATTALVIASLYVSQLISARQSSESPPTHANQIDEVLWYVENYARPAFSLLATALLTMLFYVEISGSLLTVAWAFEAVALLIAGFALRERVLRLSGLLLFFVAVFKVFAYDLRELDAMPRIGSFIVLGALLIAVSFAYSRYREKLSRFL